MNALAPVALAAADPTTPTQNTDASKTATSAFGLGFDALLKIILTQLTYQDPLKPMDNFQFVSQLAQFSQIQQGQTSNDRLETMVSAQATSQATSLLGHRVDIRAENATLSGKVTSVVFDNGAPTVTITTGTGATARTISGLSISNISQVYGE
ncbi:MAG: flagellar hook capping FlgD N-terminal domain-containing protein [Pseudomonadota bacterium]